MKELLIFLLLLLQGYSWAQQNCDQIQTQYDFNLLVLTWPEEFCQQSACFPDWKKSWKNNRVSIHGFWPTWSKSYPAKCESQWRRGDNKCLYQSYMKSLDVKQTFKNDPKLLRDIETYWPSFKKKYYHRMPDVHWFYKHQWDHHGTCYLRNMIADNPSTYKANPSGFNQTILKEYFRSTIDKVKGLDIRLTPGKTYNSKSQFASDINLRGKQDYFYLNCGYDQELDEILICYSRSSQYGKEKLIRCPKMHRDCKPPFTITIGTIGMNDL